MTKGGRCAVAFMLALAGCAPTLAHPMRVRPGVMVEAGGLVPIADGQLVRCGDSGGCGEGRTHAYGAPSLYGSIGWGAVVDDLVGLLVGLTWPGRADDLVGGGLEVGIRGFVFGTLQADWGAVGLGVDVGITGVTLTATAEVAPWPDDYFAPRLGLFHRWYLPYRPRPWTAYVPDIDAELGGLAPAWDLGARVTAGFMFVQWSISVETAGVRWDPYIIEGNGDAASMRHTLSFGITTDVRP